METIREENRAGLKYARDLNKKLISAEKASPHQEYTCPYCGCKMHRTSRNGRYYFARNKNQVHSNISCKIADEKGERTFDNTDPIHFIQKLCHTTPRNKDSSTISATNETNTQNNNSSQAKEPSMNKDLYFTSLKQIAESGIYLLEADDKQGNYRLSDFILTYKYGMNLLKDPNFILNARIIYARYEAYDYKKQSLLFRIFNEENEVVTFELIFFSKKTFKKYLYSIMEEKVKNTKTLFQKKHPVQDVLIASDSWEKIEKGFCENTCRIKSETNCHRCLFMYQAVFTNPKQLYIIPV